MRLEEIAQGPSLTGIEATQVVSVVATVPPSGGALQVIHRWYEVHLGRD